MRASRRLTAIGRLVVALLIVFMAFLVVIAVANGWSTGFSSLFGPLVILFTILNRREDGESVSRPTRPITRRPTTRSQRRPERDPLWDRWLDG